MQAEVANVILRMQFEKFLFDVANPDGYNLKKLYFEAILYFI